jgi:hypothetical protein
MPAFVSRIVENHDKPSSGQPVSLARFESRTFRIQVSSVTFTPTIWSDPYRDLTLCNMWQLPPFRRNLLHLSSMNKMVSACSSLTSASNRLHGVTGRSDVAVTLQTRIRDVLGSNPARTTGYPDRDSCFSSVPLDIHQDSPSITSPPLPSKFFAIHQSFEDM